MRDAHMLPGGRAHVPYITAAVFVVLSYTPECMEMLVCTLPCAHTNTRSHLNAHVCI